MKSPAELTDLFRAQGLKVTAQRQCIFGVLDGSVVHPTAESVHAQVVREMPTVSLRTVYQTLNDLVSMGQLEQLDLGTGSARFDPNLDAHHHLVCATCGRVADVALDFPGVSLPRESAHGFNVSSTQIVFRGTCAQCAATEAPALPEPATHLPSTHHHPDPEGARKRHG